ncbi:MAG: outer membrane lipoprotein carrier protein LolA [Bacteroidia bacterium]|nr:outer membrane lipoprotein carrier protein LolA [Bacteroidia bacterium]MCZ2277065.1 outer membrane lipoprotein carrier protein LolA [Bacteroidia bacterium]
MIRSFALSLIGIILTTQAIAQKDAKASGALKAVNENYKSFKTIKAAFTITIENLKDKTIEKQKGVLTLKGDKYRVELASQDIISDGTTIWTHLKEENEVQVNANDNSKEDQLTPKRIFILGDTGFKTKFASEKKIGESVFQTVELFPDDSKKPYFKIIATLDKTKKLVSSVKIMNKSGINLTYSVDKFTPNVDVSDSFFTFDSSKHPEAEVIDLR